MNWPTRTAAHLIGIAGFTVTLILGSGALLRAQDRAIRPAANSFQGIAVATLPERERRRGSALASGDRLKVAIHEMVDVAAAGPPGTASRANGEAGVGLRTYFQRMDLSADYSVDDDGVVSMPRLGRFQVAGRDLRDFETELTAAFARTIGRTADVHVSLQERRPVYVSGNVRGTGAFKHTGNMLVVQAVALAGGFDRHTGNMAELIEGARELERAGKLTQQLRRLLARSARLEAERLGQTSIKTPPQLVALAGDAEAAGFIAAEVAILRADQIRRQQVGTAAIAALGAARKEIEALRGKAKQLQVQSGIRSDYVKDLQKLRSSGYTSRSGLMNASSEIADIEARRQDLSAAMAAAEARQASAELVIQRLTGDHASDTARAIAATDAEIAEVRLSLASAGRLAAVLGQHHDEGVKPAGLLQPVYEIIRQEKTGTVVLPADDNSILLPGDVLKVGARPGKIY